MVKPCILTADIGNATLSYHDYRGTGPTLILIHATGFNPWLWHPVARRLAPEYRVIAPFFCDHRDADPHQGGLNWRILAGDLVGLCLRLGISRPILAGHSMGGAVCVLAHGLHVDLAAKMILLEPILLPEHSYRKPVTLEDHHLARQALRRKNHWPNIAEAEAYFRSKPLFRHWDEEMLALYLQYGLETGPDGGLKLACSPRGEAAIFMGSVSENPWSLLPKITCPVMIMEGENSESRFLLDLQDAARRFPNGRHRLVPGAGHLIPMEKPDLTTALFREYLATP